jgi:hypothetical protein
VIGGEQWFTRYFPWQHIVAVGLPEGLRAGETIRVTYGDKRGGSPGIQVQPFDEFPFSFRVFVDPLGNDEYLPLEKQPSLNVIACDPFRLNLVMPTNAVVGKPTWVLAAPKIASAIPRRPTGKVRFSSTDGSAGLPSHTFRPEDRGVHRFEEIVFNRKALLRLTFPMGFVRGRKWSWFRTTDRRVIVVGDLHGHTFSDGRGTVETVYDFAENVAGLDFCAVTDHDFQIVDWMWEH